MKKITLLVFCIFSTFAVHAEELINITNFADEDLTSWQRKSFSGETRYEIAVQNDQYVLKADSSNSASGMAMERKIDLSKTPFINWSWMIENRLPGIAEQTKEGDDYPARIYVVVNNSWKIWNTKALNYVWSSNQKQYARWNNAYVKDKAKMIAVRGKQSELHFWYHEKRNVYQDLILAFGDKGNEKANLDAYRYVDVVAIMTDTDNSGAKAVAYYGDIIFSED